MSAIFLKMLVTAKQKIRREIIQLVSLFYMDIIYVIYTLYAFRHAYFPYILSLDMSLWFYFST